MPDDKPPQPAWVKWIAIPIAALVLLLIVLLIIGAIVKTGEWIRT